MDQNLSDLYQTLRSNDIQWSMVLPVGMARMSSNESLLCDCIPIQLSMSDSGDEVNEEEVFMSDDMEEDEELSWEDGEDNEEDGESEEEEEEEEEEGESSNDEDDDGGESEAALREKEAKLRKALHADDMDSDDDLPQNTIGNVPLRWYDDFPHIGYNIEGERIIKRDRDGDNLDALVRRADDPNYKWTIVDEMNDKEIVLTPREINLLRRMQTGRVAHSEHDPYPDYVDYYTGNVNIHAFQDRPEPKRRFLPSKWEYMKVVKIAQGIREGRIKVKDKEKEKEKEEEEEKELYMMWGEDGNVTGEGKWRGAPHIAAPKAKLPGHAESYNPPEEFLFS
jgi:ribosome biogenesis protein ERB1